MIAMWIWGASNHFNFSTVLIPKFFLVLEDIPENTCYPRSDSLRFHLNAEKRNWDVSVPNYKPTILNLDVKGYHHYSLSSFHLMISLHLYCTFIIWWICLEKHWLFTEELDSEWNVPGRNASYDGHYAVEKSYPRNPLGRTGVFGRGHLPKYGPNFKSIPILTRYAEVREEEHWSGWN